MSEGSRRSERHKAKRLNYRELNDTGKRVFIDKDNYSSYSQRSADIIGDSSDTDSSITSELGYSTPSDSTPLDTTNVVKEGRLFVKMSNKEEAVAKTEVVADIAVVAEVKSLQRILSSLQEDINDHIEEHSIEVSDTVEDVDAYIARAEHLRADFRKVVKQLEGVSDDNKLELPDSLKSCDDVIANLKNYILDAKKRKYKLRCLVMDEQDKEKYIKKKLEEDGKKKKIVTADFLLSEVRRRLVELKSEFVKSQVNVTDEELNRRHKDLPENKAKVEKLSQKFQNALEIMPENYPESVKVVETISENYNNLLKDKDKYVRFVEMEMKKREILKQNKFETSSLNIKLPKFSGYNSELDIYSFKSQFEKLHLKITPRHLLPDLLKNNYLDDPALSLVKRLDDIEEIWKRLLRSYGDARIMLKNKTQVLKRIGALWKLKDAERIKNGLASLLNVMSELLKISKEHNIEQRLYNGEALDIIYGLLGDYRLTKWLTIISEKDPELVDGDLWDEFVKFLEKELRIQEEKSLIDFKHNLSSLEISQKDTSKYKSSSHVTDGDDLICNAGNEFDPSVFETDQREPLQKHEGIIPSSDGEEARLCSFCNEPGHVLTNGPYKAKLVQYFSCPKFVEMTPNQRFKELYSKRLCFQCLYPGARNDEGYHADGTCQSTYSCKHESHKKCKSIKHVLVCNEHCELPENKLLFEEYKSKFITPRKHLQQFSKDLKLSFVSCFLNPQKHEKSTSPKFDDDNLVKESGIYLLQTIEIDKKPFTVFFDTGCSDFVSRHEAVQKISERSHQEIKGPIDIGGVGDSVVVSEYGVYEVKIPLHNGENAVFFGVCLEKITACFPDYPLDGKVQRDIHDGYKSIGGDVKDLPSLPKTVGGDVDFMIGAKYMRYHPKKIFSLPSGLTIYESLFQGYNGSRGIVGGPHQVFTEIQRQNSSHATTYLNQQYKLWQMGYQINPDNHLLGIKLNDDFDFYEDIKGNLEKASTASYAIARKQRKFYEVESAGSEILYRCLDCRKCTKCKNGEHIESLSIKEEVEQDVIDKSVSVENGKTIAYLPFMEDPISKLAPNKKNALAVYKTQLNKLNRCEKDKLDVINSERKLQELGHVDYVKNLPAEIQMKLKEHPVQNFIPWRSVWNTNSMTTPCRIVFDASQPTPSSYSLNDIVAKGRNNMNNLIEIVIRWRSYKHAFHSDIQKMYNSVKLDDSHWCFQRYIWQRDLDPNIIPEEKVIKTIIYGVKSSGNQAGSGLRKTTEKRRIEYPRVHEIIKDDTFVDDCMSGENSANTYQRADEISLVLKDGGFGLKGFTFAGEKPASELSEDGESIKCAGMKWYSETDELQLDFGELNFAKKNQREKDDN